MPALIPWQGLRARVLLAWLLLACATAGAAPPFEGREPLGLSFGLLRDAGGALGIDEVSSPGMQARFADYRAVLHNFGYTRDALWMRITIHNPHGVPTDYLVDVGPPRLPDVRFFEQQPGSGWRESRSGLAVPVAERRVPSRQPLLPVSLAAGESRTVFVRVTGDNALALGALQWRDEDFFVWEDRLDQVNLFQIGALAAFILFALVLGIFSREILFVLFSASLFVLGMYEATILQYTHLWFWPDAAGWSQRSPGVAMVLAIGLVSLLNALLLKRLGIAFGWLKILDVQWILALLILPFLWVDYSVAIQVTALFGFFLIVGFMLAGLAAFSRDPRSAVLLMGSFLMLWVVSILRILQFQGVLPEEVISMEYSWAVAPVISGMLMTVLLARNLRAMREAHQRAQQEALESATMARRELEAEVRERTRDVEEARRRAEEASEAKSRFLAQVSHEFRTPLHGVLGYAGLMAEEPRPPEDRRRLETIQRSGRHLLRLIDDLIQLARSDERAAMLAPCPVNLPGLMREILHEVQLLAAEHGMALHEELDPDLPAGVRVDATRLRQVLINLLTNACLHSQGTTAVLSVRVLSMSADAARLCFSVRDDGVGLPEGGLDAYSVVFARPRDVRSSGLGLGLPIVKEWINRMGGELTADSAPGKGCRFDFCLELPVVEPPALPGEGLAVGKDDRGAGGPAEREKLADAGHDGEGNGSGAQERPLVLVVDDQAVNRQLMADLLARAGCRALVADGGPAALRILGERPGGIAMAFIDQMMPGMDGWECLRRAREAGIRVPFVLVSAAAPQPPPAWDESLRFEGFLAKPITPGQIREVLASVGPAAGRGGPDAPDVPPAERARLHALAEMGLVSGIEDWIREVRQAGPAAAALASAVEEALGRMDLAAIGRLARPKNVGGP